MGAVGKPPAGASHLPELATNIATARASLAQG